MAYSSLVILLRSYIKCAILYKLMRKSRGKHYPGVFSSQYAWIKYYNLRKSGRKTLKNLPVADLHKSGGKKIGITHKGHPENKNLLVIQNEKHNIYWGKKQFCYIPEASFTSLHNHLLDLNICRICSRASEFPCLILFCSQSIKSGVHCIQTKHRSRISDMTTIFWDRKGILLMDFMPKGTTINANRCCETLRKLLRGILSGGIVLLHDNSRPHTAAATQELLDQFGWEIFDHLPYSPDLAPSDFHIFLKRKGFLGVNVLDVMKSSGMQ
ncbi:hypothetical protein AVEN_157695-1 [Araneus ventricosus]|uniref:Histone-lysine N-methyltransferase SETMAR n=1 Tax=Araneus ventricosus TaxID=182803 RepID=A0A4Y2JVA2_ARAVE|nr:hypothetical protein AVEN_157695-1 [Araneus ventricosus]